MFIRIMILVWAKALWTTVGGKKFPPFLIRGIEERAEVRALFGHLITRNKAENTGFNWHLFRGSGIIMALYLGRRDLFVDIYASRTIYK